MQSTQIRSTVILMFKSIVKGEKELETLRQLLLNHLSNHNISLVNCFLHVSMDKNNITQEDMEIFLTSHQVRHTDFELSTFPYATYQQFLDLLLPSSQLSLKQFNQKDIVYSIPIPETIMIITQILAKNIETIRKMQAHIDTLLLRYDQKQLIKLLTPETSKQQPTIMQLLRNLDYEMNLDDLICLLRRLDKDQDSDIKQRDWQDIIKPKLPLKQQQQQVVKVNQPSPQPQRVAQVLNMENQENQPKRANVQHLIPPQQKATIPIDVEQFKTHLTTLGKYLQDIEALKIELSSRADFSIDKLFTYFDLNMDNEIDSQDLKLTLMQLGLQINDDQIDRFIRYYSKRESKTELVQCEFAELFNDNVNQKLNTNQQQLSFATKKLITSLFSSYIEMMCYQNKSKHQLVRNSQSIKCIFNYIDCSSKGRIFMNEFNILEINRIVLPKIYNMFDPHREGMSLYEFEQYFNY